MKAIFLRRNRNLHDLTWQQREVLLLPSSISRLQKTAPLQLLSSLHVTKPAAPTPTCISRHVCYFSYLRQTPRSEARHAFDRYNLGFLPRQPKTANSHCLKSTMSTSSGEAKTSDGNSANDFTPPPSSTTSSPSTQSPFDHNKPYTVTACGINSQVCPTKASSISQATRDQTVNYPNNSQNRATSGPIAITVPTSPIRTRFTTPMPMGAITIPILTVSTLGGGLIPVLSC